MSLLFVVAEYTVSMSTRKVRQGVSEGPRPQVARELSHVLARLRMRHLR